MVEQTKATRVRRVEVETVEGTAKGVFIVNGERISYSDLPAATIAKMLAYGTTQLVNDALAGEDDKEAALKSVVEKLRSGDWTVTRNGGGALTMNSVAADMIRAKAKAAGRKITPERVKELVKQILSAPDSAGYMAVGAELARRQSESIEFDIDLSDYDENQ